jgi:hypothetical protein
MSEANVSSDTRSSIYFAILARDGLLSNTSLMRAEIAARSSARAISLLVAVARRGGGSGFSTPAPAAGFFAFKTALGRGLVSDPAAPGTGITARPRAAAGGLPAPDFSAKMALGKILIPTKYEYNSQGIQIRVAY